MIVRISIKHIDFKKQVVVDMAGRFYLKKFSNININDVFFDTLKTDYPGTSNSTGFVDWFNNKANNGATALVFEDELGIGAFIALKLEEEEIELQGSIIPKEKRLKISTFRIAPRYQGYRIGEGAIGLILWKWLPLNCSEVYLTVFQKQSTLISLFERFGFVNKGYNLNGECVYIKSRNKIDFSNPYKSFPFISSNLRKVGYVIIDDIYHDTMFAYSELANNKIVLQDSIGKSVTNGLTKIYVGGAAEAIYNIGDPVLIYRRYTQGSGKRYRSCITSYCVVTNIIQAKRNYVFFMSFDDLLKCIGNKSIFNKDELYKQYNNNRNLMVIELLYYGYFGAGNNVNMDWLDNNGCWSTIGQYPTSIQLSLEQFKKILKEGKIDVQNVIID